MNLGIPTVEDIIELDRKLRDDYYGEIHRLWEDDDRYYECDFKGDLHLPTEFKDAGIVLSTGRDLVDTRVDHTNISNCRVKVPPKSQSQKDKDAAEMARKLAVGIVYQTNVESPISPWRTAAKHCWIYGLGVLKHVWDVDRWPDRPQPKNGEDEEEYAARLDKWRESTHATLPISIVAINPRNVMIDPSYIEPQFIIEHHERLTLDVAKRWPSWKNPKGKKMGDPVDYISWWDKDYRCELADGEPLLKYGIRRGIVKHPYGFLPYTPIDLGLGNISYDGKLEKRYVGLIRYMKETLKADSLHFSLLDITLKNGAWPWGIIEGKSDDIAAMDTIDRKYGKVTQIPEGVKLTMMPPESPSEALWRHMALIGEKLAVHGAPRSLQGMGETGVRSAADRRLMIAEGGSKGEYNSDAFQYGTARVLERCMRIIKHVIPGKVRIWAKTPIDEFDMVVDKDELQEPFTCNVEFAPVSEEDEYRRHDDLMRLSQSGIGTKQWAREQIPNMDVKGLERQERKEMMRNDPLLLQIISQYAAGKLSAEIARREAAEGLASGLPQPLAPEQPVMPVQEGQSQTAPEAMPGGMTTGIPNRAAPGSAEEIQLALQKMRSAMPLNAFQGFGGGGARGAQR